MIMRDLQDALVHCDYDKLRRSAGLIINRELIAGTHHLRRVELDSQLGFMFETAADVRMSHNFVRNAVLLFAFVVANDQCETARVAGGKADSQSASGYRHLLFLARYFFAYRLIGECPVG